MRSGDAGSGGGGGGDAGGGGFLILLETTTVDTDLPDHTVVLRRISDPSPVPEIHPDSLVFLLPGRIFPLRVEAWSIGVHGLDQSVWEILRIPATPEDLHSFLTTTLLRQDLLTTARRFLCCARFLGTAAPAVSPGRGWFGGEVWRWWR